MRIHFIGIGGIGVSGLAQYYLAKGHQVSGSDLTDSEMTEVLKKKGAKIFIGSHNPKNLTKIATARKVKRLKIIYSLAVQKNNPELREAKKMGIKVQSYPEALGELTKKYYTVAVAGTHGKSTVTAMLSLILIKAGFDPTVILGTKLKEFHCNRNRAIAENLLVGGGSNFRMGKINPVEKRNYLVIEADEWQASFLNYWPKIIVLTNIEKEHLDYYRNLNHILKTYQEFISHLSRGEVLVVNGEDKNISKIKIQKSKLQIKIQKFSLKQKEIQKLKKILKVPGEHNILNALAALSVARVLKIPDKISFRGLSKYRGAWRRFEVSGAELGGTTRGTRRKIIVISDYAHHPTEIEATLKAVREKFPNKTIWCIFQPHQYQRTFYLFENFVKVFKKEMPDKLIVTDIFDVAGREEKKIKKKVNSKKLIKAIDQPEAIYLPKEKILRYLKKNLKGQEVLIIMGAGDIYKLIEQF